MLLIPLMNEYINKFMESKCTLETLISYVSKARSVIVIAAAAAVVIVVVIAVFRLSGYV